MQHNIDPVEHDEKRSPWKVIIADDEPEIHSVTRLVLDDFQFDNRRLVFLSAFSGNETCALIRENPDTALLLLDVVMESEHAGLDVVKYIRETLKNGFVRIILRTGQPGQAPERKVISTYDINDYKDKTELTTDRLYTTIMASLRAYRDLQRIERNRKSLESIVATSPKILGFQSQGQLAQEVLNQLTGLLSLENGSPQKKTSSAFIIWDREEPFCLAGTGRFAEKIRQSLTGLECQAFRTRVMMAMDSGEQLFDDRSYAGFFRTLNGVRHVVYIESHRKLEDQDYELIRLFISTTAAAFENIHLNKELEATHREIIDTLGEMIECRFREMGNHVKRVAAFAQLLALKTGMNEKDAEILRFASPMHDIGKIGIPDIILKKPGRLTPDEFEVMKQHTMIGYNILKGSDRQILKYGATIALQHHERWDGLGYPNGLKGEQIHIIGRIIRLVDVFDALGNERVYKKAWELDEIVSYLIEERGTQFDPKLVDIFLENIGEFVEIKKQYPDETQ
ncbi:DUF3369 domain-containing protein [bacterium]|nr:DUF3369 domain-containing protein [candidate division CSSED10-310 bacterium]